MYRSFVSVQETGYSTYSESTRGAEHCQLPTMHMRLAYSIISKQFSTFAGEDLMETTMLHLFRIPTAILNDP